MMSYLADVNLWLALAFANAASFELVTFDGGFRQYEKLALTILS